MIHQKISEISTLLEVADVNDIGLLSGISGINLALFYLDPETFGKEFETKINRIVSLLNNGISEYTYCSGISGFLWSLNYLAENGAIDKSISKVFGEYQTFLYQKMKIEINNHLWDFLHGAIGAGLYFLSDFKNNISYKYTVELIDNLYDIRIEETNGQIRWNSLVYPLNEPPLEVSNFGIAHGIPSIIAFLLKVYKKEIEKTKSKKLIQGAINYLLSNQNEIKEDSTYFPTWISKNGPEVRSRLGWCYGDLSIAIVLYNAAQVFYDKTLEEFALKVMRHSSQRRDLEVEIVQDAGLCHGSAGIGHVFNRMFWNTKDPLFKETASYWFEKTLDMSKYNDGLAGYKAFRLEKYGGLHNEYGILEGIAGIGLAMHSWITQTEPLWDECLLLS